MNEEILEQAIVSELLENCLSSWKDNGECREYQDLSREDAVYIAKEIIKRLS